MQGTDPAADEERMGEDDLGFTLLFGSPGFHSRCFCMAHVSLYEL